jgi:hypothetical protein
MALFCTSNFTLRDRDPLQLEALAAHSNLPLHSELIRRFLFDQLYPNAPLSGDKVNLNICPICGMHRQRIRATPSWRNSHGRYDCMFLEKDPTLPGFRGLHAVQVCLFFSFKHNRVTYPCALVQWFVPIGDHPCEDTGMCHCTLDTIRESPSRKSSFQDENPEP